MTPGKCVVIVVCSRFQAIVDVGSDNIVSGVATTFPVESRVACASSPLLWHLRIVWLVRHCSAHQWIPSNTRFQFDWCKGQGSGGGTDVDGACEAQA